MTGTKPFPNARSARWPLLAVAALYALASWTVQWCCTQPDQSGFFFLSSGLALAALLLGGPRFFWAIFAGALLANAFSGYPLEVAALMALGKALGALVGARLLRRQPAFDASLSSLRDLLQLGLCGVAGVALSAAMVVGAGGAAAHHRGHREGLETS